MLENWYSSKKIRQILQISSQCLYEMRKTGRIESKKISDKKYLFKLPKQFTSSDDAKIAIYARLVTPTSSLKAKSDVLLKTWSSRRMGLKTLTWLTMSMQKGLMDLTASLSKTS